MSRLLILPVLCALVGGLLALPSSAAAGGIEFEVVSLGDSGVSGSGTLEPVGTPEAPADQTRINLELSGLQPGSEHVNHVHSGTSCDDFGAVVYDLDSIVADADGNASVTTTLPTSAQVFAEEAHVVIVHAGATLEEDPTPIACAVLAPAEVATGIGAPEGPLVTAPPAAGSGGFLAEEGGGVMVWWWYMLAAGFGLLLLGGLATLVRIRTQRETG
jgi:Cu/Zn superoxide dismutase